MSHISTLVSGRSGFEESDCRGHALQKWGPDPAGSLEQAGVGGEGVRPAPRSCPAPCSCSKQCRRPL